ncbi:MAG TPA: LysR family transcriptional regulator [Dermatophilaceae bacterium]|jgi:DNA-binding transcriptional LysR family regulator
MAMELRHVRYFLAVVDAGSVTAASPLVHVTQPSLSRQLRLFERGLGLTLFTRTGGRLVLSAAGRQFVPVARDLAHVADAAAEAAATLAAGRLQHINIAAPGTTFTDVLAPFLATLHPDDPLPAVSEEPPQLIYDALQAGADLAISTERPPAGLASQRLAVLPVWAYVPPGHRWAGRASVTVADLVNERLLLLTGDYSPRRVLDHWVDQAGLSYSSMLEFGTPQVAQAVAAAGRGIAIVSDDARFGLLPLDILSPGGALHIRLYAAWDGEHHAATAIRALASRLSDYCVQRYGPQVAPGAPLTTTRDDERP